MHRIDTLTADPDANGDGKAGFRDGTPPGLASTRMNARWCNAVQEELANLIESTGLTLDPDDYTQLYQAFFALAAGAYRAQEFAALTGMQNCYTSSGAKLHGLCSPLFPPGTTDTFADVVAVGEGGTILRSRVGGPFDTETPDASYVGLFTAVAQHRLGVIAVGAAEEIQTRPHNSSGWTRRNHASNQLYSVATANKSGGLESAVAVGAGGTIYNAVDTLSTWTSQTSEFGTDVIICVRNEGGASGVYMAVTVNGGLMRSVNDGGTWFPVHTITGADTVTVGTNALTYHPLLGWFCLYKEGATKYGIAYSANGADWTNGTTSLFTATHLGVGSEAGLVATPTGVIWPSTNLDEDDCSAVGACWKVPGVDFAPDVGALSARHTLISVAYRPAFLLYTPGHFYMLGYSDAGDGAIFTSPTFAATP